MIHVKLAYNGTETYFATRLSVVQVLHVIAKMYNEETAIIKMGSYISGFRIVEEVESWSVEYIKGYTQSFPHSLDQVVVYTREGADHYHVGDLVSAFKE